MCVFKTENVTYLPVMISIWQEEKSWKDEKLARIKFTLEKVKNKLANLKSNKSHGNNESHPKLLIKISDAIANPLAQLFQTLYSRELCPTIWEYANITSLFKNGIESAFKTIALLAWQT